MNFKQLYVLALFCFGFGVPFSLLADPMISVDPIEIETALNTGDVEESSFNITNEGDEDLQFTIRPELVGQPDEDMNIRSIRQTNKTSLHGPHRDELGDVFGEYNLNQAPWSGLAWDGEMMNGIALNGNMVTFDPDAGEVVEQIALNMMCYGLVYQDPFFWTVTMNEDSLSNLVRFNRDGNILEIIETQSFGIVGIASDGESVYFNAFGPQGRRAMLHQVSFEQGLVRTIDCGNIFQRNELTLEWVNDHDDGHLWAIEWNTGTLSQVDISGDEPQLIQRTDLVQNQMYGLAHDGVNLWYSTMRGDWYVIDDGIRELSWISFDQVEGVLERGADLDVIVILNADELIEGLYEAEIHILSNDPENPDVVVSVSMTVTGAPVLEVVWSEVIGYPDVINWNAAYFEVFAGGPYRIPVTILNSGTAELIIESITCENEVFTSQPDNLNLDPGEEVEINFIFNTDEPGRFQDNMVLVWNNPNEDDFEIPLNAEAFNPPIIVIEPGAIEGGDGEVEEHIINISNEGDDVLRFRIEIEIISEPDVVIADQQSGERQGELRAPYRDDLGDVINEYNVGQGNWGGLAWDGDLIWGINGNQGQLISFDPEAGEIVGNLNMQGQYFGLSYGEDSFWIGAMGQRNARIVQIDLEGNAISTVDVPGIAITGVSYDGENLWYYSFDQQGDSCIIRQITTEGEQLREVDCTNIIPGMVHSLTWVPEHEDGNLWVLSWENGSLYQVSVNEDQPEILQQAQFNPGEGFGLDHDGDDLLYCRQGASWFKIDDGVSEIQWITVDPTEGEIEPDGDMDIVVTLDPTGLIGGMYEAELHILSNDPGNPDLVVSIVLEVTGVPEIEVDWPEEFGYPDRVDWNLAYEDLFTGTVYPVTVEIINTGTDDLLVEEISCVSEVFSGNLEDFVLQPGRSQEVNFLLAAEENGRYESEMVIISNSPEEVLSIPLVAVTTGPPQISIEPNAIESDLEVGSIEEHVIGITNDGESTLRFTIDHNIIDPELDSRIRTNPRSATESEFGPVRDEFGDVMAEYRLDQGGIVDIASDGDRIWCLNSIQSNLFTFDPETGEVGNHLGLDGEFISFDFDGEFFWLGDMGGNDRGAQISQVDRNGNLLRTFQIDGLVIFGISHDGENLWISSMFPQGEISVIKQITTEGEILREINCQNVNPFPTFCLEYVPEHENGNLWIIDRLRGSLIQLDVSNDLAEIVQETPVDEADNYGITHDGENLWYITGEGVLREIDDGISEVAWITYEPAEGEIDPDADSDIILTLDATDLEPGVYEVDLNISSNDPDNEVVVVNVRLQVEPNSVYDDSGKPITFNLSSAYPNPFNGATRIEYTLPERTDLSINVYDISGHLVENLFSGAKSTGTHDIIWDSVDNANGVYLIRLQSPHFNAIQKVTLLK